MTVIHVIEPFASGVTTAIINIIRQLPEINHLVIHGSRMWVDSMENVRRKFPSETSFISWNHVDREIRPLQDGRALMDLIRHLKKYRHGVVHLHSSKAGFLGRIACRLLGIRRVLYTPHCASFIRTDIGHRKRRLFRLLEKFAGAFGGLVVGCGETEAALYRELGLPVRWVANGVEPRETEKAPNPQRITFAGIANDQKRPALFNKIAGAFEKEGTPFVWVGDGQKRGALTAENIEVTGWVGGAAVEAYLKETLVYLSTSGWEGLSFSVLEAMNASCALLLSNVPGNRDLVRPGVNGHLFDDEGEAVKLLRKMMEDPEKTLRMGEASRRLVEAEFSLHKMGEGYRSIYDSMMSLRRN